MVPESSLLPFQPPRTTKAVETAAAPVRCQDVPNDSYDDHDNDEDMTCLMPLDELMPISEADIDMRESNGSFSSISSSYSATTSTTSTSTATESCSDLNSSLSSLTHESSSPSSSSSPSRQGGTIMLPSDYRPSDADVICARGRSGWDHPGNVHYRQLIADATPWYSQATNKLQKSLIVSEIVQSVHDRMGKFIKRKNKRCSWVQVDETFHREKIGQSLRDSTMIMTTSSVKVAPAASATGTTFKGSTNRQYYKSATSVKKRHQQQQQQKRRRQSEGIPTADPTTTTTTNRCKSRKTNVLHCDKLDQVVLSNAIITYRMDELREKLQLLSCFNSTSGSSGIGSKSNSNLVDPPLSSSVGDTSAVTSSEEEEQDSILLALFTETNSSILKTIKRDAPTTSNQFTLATTATDTIDESSAQVGGTTSREMVETNSYY